MPPYDITVDQDVATFVDLNSRRNVPIPLCISTQKRNLVVGDQKIDKAHVVVGRSPVHLRSQSVNQHCNNEHEEKFVLISPMGLDDIETGHPDKDIDDNVNTDDVHDEESANYEFDYDDAFAYDEDFVQSDRDAFDGAYDPYFNVFVDSATNASPIQVEEDVPLNNSPPTQYSLPTQVRYEATV
ncbi:hypothetical protein LIER_32576 [Lithospermum erythrorhizon]|uniref:Uncharacterized protein n=1 Tax=Lithospermum erythrorhizon TaxID=34254 RepID=A0AAV3RW08_LITER